MKAFFIIIYALLGFVMLGSFTAGFFARLNLDGSAFQKYMKVFAVCGGLFAVFAVIAAICDVKF
jgi:hypothetical protein